MRRGLAVLVVFFLLSVISPACLQASTDEQVCFSPGGNCAQKIVDQLNGAEKSVLVQAYSFTSKPIAEALINAFRRGVKVKVIADKSQLRGKGSKIKTLADAGVPVSIDTAHAIAHDKVIVIDGVTVVTGSFNFTRAAEDKNAENVLIIRNKKVAAKYRANWYRHKKHSKPYLIEIEKS